MSVIYVNGPAGVFAGVGNANAAVFFGWTDDRVRITIDDGFNDVFTDLGGDKIPVDKQWMANQAFVRGDFIQYNQLVYRQMLNRISKTGIGEGVVAPGDIGSLMLQEGYAYPLWIVASYAGKPVFIAAGMDAGYRFYNSFLLGPEDEERSSKPLKISLVWNCLRAISTAGALAGGGTLFDHNVTGLPPYN